jgi:hypothetical protein
MKLVVTCNICSKKLVEVDKDLVGDPITQDDIDLYSATVSCREDGADVSVTVEQN